MRRRSGPEQEKEKRGEVGEGEAGRGKANNEPPMILNEALTSELMMCVLAGCYRFPYNDSRQTPSILRLPEEAVAELQRDLRGG